MVSTRKTKAETTETPLKKSNIEDNNGKQTILNTAKKENTTKLHDSLQMDRMKT